MTATIREKREKYFRMEFQKSRYSTSNIKKENMSNSKNKNKNKYLMVKIKINI